MAITNFIPTVWSETLYSQLDKQYIAVRNCNRDFEGDIKGKGSTVKICGIGDISISDYVKDTDMSTPETLSDMAMTLSIDRAKYFNFQIDDVDRAQSNPKLMDEAMRKAASALANEADAYVYSLVDQADAAVMVDAATEDNIIDHIIDARKKLYQANVTNADDIIIEVSPEIAALILKAKIDLGANNGETLENGMLGKIAGCKIYVSNNIPFVDGYHRCIARTKRAIAFAEQISEVEAYRPEKRFADAVKGLHLYGAKAVYPTEMVLLKFKVAA